MERIVEEKVFAFRQTVLAAYNIYRSSLLHLHLEVLVLDLGSAMPSSFLKTEVYIDLVALQFRAVSPPRGIQGLFLGLILNKGIALRIPCLPLQI